MNKKRSLTFTDLLNVPHISAGNVVFRRRRNVLGKDKANCELAARRTKRTYDKHRLWLTPKPGGVSVERAKVRLTFSSRNNSAIGKTGACLSFLLYE